MTQHLKAWDISKDSSVVRPEQYAHTNHLQVTRQTLVARLPVQRRVHGV